MFLVKVVCNNGVSDMKYYENKVVILVKMRDVEHLVKVDLSTGLFQIYG